MILLLFFSVLFNIALILYARDVAKYSRRLEDKLNNLKN